MIHDITEDKQIEREREDLIGCVAHELRNPLANLLLTNELIHEAVKENNTKDISIALARNKKNILRLNKIIAGLYKVIKINSYILKPDIETFHFGEMIRESINTVEILQAFYKVIEKGDGDILMSGDRYRLIQVVTNFLSNSFKYSNGKKEVMITVEHDDKMISLSVKGEGMGISQKNLEHVFERFFRAKKTKNLEVLDWDCIYVVRSLMHIMAGYGLRERKEKDPRFIFQFQCSGGGE